MADISGEAAGVSWGSGCAAIAPVVSGDAVSGLDEAAATTRFGFRSGRGAKAGATTVAAGFACLLLFVCLTCDLLACVFAASSPETRSGGKNNAQNTTSDTVALLRFILVDRSGFAISPG